MPRREDEFYAARKEERLGLLKPLCPYCGRGKRLYYNKVFKVWRCGWCEASFPIPSGGKPAWYEIEAWMHKKRE